MNAIEFPLLDTCIDYHTFFQDEIVFFYFHLTRIQNYSEFTYFSNRYDNVLRIIKQQMEIDRDSILPYLSQLYKLIANTRDIHHGKGEHDISYMMIWKLYQYFPTLAIYIIHRFVQTTENQYYVYGSWRDIKYLCAFVKQNSRLGCQIHLDESINNIVLVSICKNDPQSFFNIFHCQSLCGYWVNHNIVSKIL